MSFVEKKLWIEIAATVVVWGGYYWRLIGWVQNGGLSDPGFVGAMGAHFVGAVVVLVLIQVLLSIVAELTTAKADREARDEREDLAALRSTRVGHAVLVLLVVALAGLAYLAGATGRVDVAPVTAAGFVVVANMALGCVVQAELVRLLLNVVLIRRPG